TAGLDTRPPRGSTPDVAALVAGTQAQARLAIAEADLCLFVLAVREGLTALDEEIAATLRSGAVSVVVVGNKAEGGATKYYAHELHRLGLGEPVLISALQGTDTGDLLDVVVERLPPESRDDSQ